MSALAMGGAGLSLVLVRLGWGGRRGVAAAGWALAAVSLLALTLAHGAWGLAMGAVAGMTAALALVLHAGWASPAGRARKAANGPAAALPQSWSGTGRRLAVFGLTVPVSLAASVWLAYGLNAAMRQGSELNADSVAAVLFVQPIAWAVLMSWQMTRPGPRQMVPPPLFAALLGTLLWMIA